MFPITFKKKICTNEKKFLQSVWRYNGGRSPNVNFFAQYLLFCRENHLPDVQLTYCQCLLEQGKKDLALIGLRDFIRKHKLVKIHEYLPLSDLAYESGICNDRIKKSAAIFRLLEKNRKGNTFENYLKNKSIAVVGNSPNILGKGLGKDIDHHDVVMRMNTFQINDELLNDTGQKINIFVNNANEDVIYSRNFQGDALKRYDWIYMAMNFWHIALSDFLSNEVDKFLDMFYDIVVSGNINICYFYPNLSLKLRNETNLAVSTTGLKILYYLKEYNFNFDIYGFNDELKPNGYLFKQNPVKQELGTDRVKNCGNDYFGEDLKSSSFYRNYNFYETGHNFNEELRFRRRIGLI